jgi:choline-sulfatase
MRSNRFKKKNIILVSIDCLRADCIDLFPCKQLLKKYNLHNELVFTPTLNQLVGEGTLYTNCFTASTYTTASHASILTGCYPIRHGIQEYFNSRLQRETIFQHAKKIFGGSVSTLICTDFPFILGKYLGFNRKVDHYFDGNERKAITTLKNQLKSRSYLALFHFGNVHTPYGFSSLEKDNPVFEKTVRKLALDNKIPLRKHDVSEWPEKDRSEKEAQLRILYHKALDKMSENKEYVAIMKMYVEGVSYFDRNRFKRFMQLLSNDGFLEDAIIFIFSDHGECWSTSSHGHHDNLYDDTIRVPLIIRGEGFKAGEINKTLVRTVDIVPTILELWGKKQPPNMDGRSLLNSVMNSPRTAIGEIWSCDDIGEIKKTMRRSIEKGRLAVARTPVSRGFLWKEYIRTNKYKMINEYMRGRKKRRFYKVDGQTEREIQLPEKENEQLKKVLSNYRKITTPTTDFSCCESKAEILKKELRLLGYKV